MGEKVDLRVERTQKTIQSAFIKLLHETTFDNIYVKDISDLAMINRKTFYAYYDNKEILYDEIISDVFETLCNTLIYTKSEPSENLNKEIFYSDISEFLTILEDKKNDLFYLLHPTLHHLWFPILESTIMLKKKQLFIKSDIEKTSNDIPLKLYIDTISSLFVIWIYWWLSQEEYTVEQGTYYLSRMMSKNMTNIFRYTKQS